MPLDLSNNISPAVLTILAAVVGYAYREYRNRVKPFLQIVRIDGTVTKTSDQVAVSQSTAAKLSSTFYLKKLESDAALGHVAEVRKRIALVKSEWPELLKTIEEVLVAATDADLCQALAEALDLTMVDDWLLRLLVKDLITVPQLQQGALEKVPVHEDQNENGRVFFQFPGASTSFGRSFVHAAVRAKADGFIQAVRALDQPCIRSVFSQLKAIGQREYQAAMECAEEIKATTNEQGRWCFHCYLANLGQHPMVIETAASVRVADKTRVKYREECYLALIKQSADGEPSITDTATPLVIRGGEDLSFALITRKTQKNMHLGSALREAFERGEAHCSVTITVRRPGLLKRQSFSSQVTRFVESETA